MKTSIQTDTFSIQLTEISIDSDNPSLYELTFNATISIAHALTTPFGIDDPSAATDYYENDSIDFEFNIAQRHGNGFYHIIKNDHSGDYLDSIDDITFAYGQQITDFLIQICKLLNVPFYPNN